MFCLGGGGGGEHVNSLLLFCHDSVLCSDFIFHLLQKKVK